MHYATAISINELQGSYADTVPRNSLHRDALLWINLESWMEQRPCVLWSSGGYLDPKPEKGSGLQLWFSKIKNKAASGVKFGFWLGIISPKCL